MILPKEEGGLGVRDLRIITGASNVKRTAMFWGQNGNMKGGYSKAHNRLQFLEIPYGSKGGHRQMPGMLCQL